ncbi:MAG: DNA mismatch repair protein MutS, partial [Planctomycetaceae bacterium]
DAASPSSPLREYERRLLDCTLVVEAHRQTDRRMSQWRGVTFVAAMIAVVLSSTVHWSPGWVVLVPAAGFAVLVAWHQRVLRVLRRADRSVGYYQRAIARIDDRWEGVGPTGERYLKPNHLYAADLDLFGTGSLFQLLCRARTRVGEDRLASWLLQASDRPTVELRQAAVRELSPDVDLLEELALLSGEVHEEIDQNQLRRWARGTPRPISATVRVAAVVLAAATVSALIGWFLGLRLTWLLASGTLMGVFLFGFRRRIRDCARAADAAASGLLILARVLSLLEDRRFADPLLSSMRVRLETGGLSPSQQIARLHRFIHNLNNCLRNQFFSMFALLLALPVHLVHAIESWRSHVGSHIGDWLETIADFEALVSFAGFSYENPDAVFPGFSESSPHFVAEQIGHPLLPKRLCVRNDLHFDAQRPLMLISGSNMSGKSTLLRTVGVNAVLAQAGAPVCAKRLTLSPLQVASVMRIHDSLQDGRSFFYAALERLKALVDESRGPTPLLFLLDEILQGTNSHDRRIGAEGVIRLLMERGNIGLVTTHDLALTGIVATLDGRAVNCHFEDDLVDGRMSFDYRLRPGVVEKSNALELMRLMGLDV